MVSLPNIPDELVQMKTQTQIFNSKKKLINFDVREASYNNFCNFAQNYALQEKIELNQLVSLRYDSIYYFTYKRKINNILVQNYEADLYQDNPNCYQFFKISYYKFNDLLIDLDKFLLLKTLSIRIVKSKNSNYFLTYPLKILQYISSQKNNLEELQLYFINFNGDVIDSKFCEELTKCFKLNSIDIRFELADISVDKAFLISQALQRMPNLSKISIIIPQKKLKGVGSLVSIIKKDTQNNQLRKLKLGQYSMKKLDPFNYDLQILSNAPNLEELQIYSYQVKIDEEYFKYIIKNTLLQLQKLRKLSFQFKYSENDESLKLIKNELSNFKSLEVLEVQGYINDEFSFFQLQYNKFGAIQKMVLKFDNESYYGLYGPEEEMTYEKKNKENIRRQQLLENEIQKSGSDFQLATLKINHGIFQQQQFINMLSSINQKAKKIYFLTINVTIQEGDEDLEFFQESRVYYYLIKKYQYAVNIDQFC
ncbi:hypothetical protein ABPG74_020219 [Tetrahymena malaccensis]